MQQEDKKKLIRTAAGKILKKLRGNKSLYILSMEYEISTSLLNSLERGLKDPQLTTVFKLSEALGVQASDFVKMIEEELPEGFTLTG
jgi:transcriptional regulator with XRE-family HTH domain